MGIQKLWQWLRNPPDDAPAATLLLRVMAGAVFLWEGILKFVYTNQGVGRFTKLGFPFPGATATFDGVLEIVGGILLITGLLTRLIAIPFIIEMLVAILSTKIPLYLGTSPLPLPPVRQMGSSRRQRRRQRQRRSKSASINPSIHESINPFFSARAAPS